ncbi:MAG: flippase [Actinomycetota bacterium]
MVGGGLLIFGGTIFAKVTGFLRQFIIIRMLSPEKYGLFALGLAFMTIAAGLGNLGLYQGSQRYIAYHDSLDQKDKVKGTVHATLRIIAFTGIPLALIIASLSGVISNFLGKPDFRQILILFCLGIPLAMYAHIMVSFFFGFRRADIAVFLNDILFGALSAIFILIGLLIARDTRAAVAALLVSLLVSLAVSIYFYHKTVTPRLKEAAAFPLTGELLLFSLPLFFSGVSYLILNNTDTLMLGYFVSSAEVGFYNAAFLLMAFLPIFLNSFAIIFMPVLAGLVARGAGEESRRLYRAVTKWVFILTIPLIATFFLFPSQVLTLLFPESYAQAGKALAILAAAEFFHTTLGPNEQALIAYGATKIHLVGYTTAAVCNIVLNATLIPRMGITGAAAATGISLVALNLVLSGFLYARFKVHPFGRKNLIPLILTLAAGGALYLPLRSLVSYSKWLALTCYPILLIVGVVITLLAKSYSDEDLIVYRAIKNRLRALR